MYEQAFIRIKEMTNEEDLDRLVNHFISVEDTNFALFNFVNEQNNQIENLNEEIQEVTAGTQALLQFYGHYHHHIGYCDHHF